MTCGWREADFIGWSEKPSMRGKTRQETGLVYQTREGE